MTRLQTLSAVFVALAFSGSTVWAEPLQWAVRTERLEYRFGENSDVIAWKGDAYVGTDEFKVRYIGEGEYARPADILERFENHLVVQTPISRFFDAKAGVRYDAPRGPDRLYATFGVQGLAPQWFEVDLDFFISENGDTSIRFDGDYEALITNRIILRPSLEFELPFSDDRAIGVAAFGPRLEVGARLTYDLIDRAVVPYIGVHYERVFGETADLRRADGEKPGAFFFVAGVTLRY